MTPAESYNEIMQWLGTHGNGAALRWRRAAERRMFLIDILPALKSGDSSKTNHARHN